MFSEVHGMSGLSHHVLSGLHVCVLPERVLSSQRGMMYDLFVVVQGCALTAQLTELLEKGMASGLLLHAAATIALIPASLESGLSIHSTDIHLTLCTKHYTRSPPVFKIVLFSGQDISVSFLHH